jgi:hypothetical protein
LDGDVLFGSMTRKGLQGPGIHYYDSNFRHKKLIFGTFKDGNLSGSSGMYFVDNKDLWWKKTGQFENNKLNGLGSLILSSGISYVGQWKEDKLDGKATLIYADSTTYTGEWIMNQPQFDALHPMVKECLDKKLCTNTLPTTMPQYMSDSPHFYYCEGCWSHNPAVNWFPKGTYMWTLSGMRCRCTKE